ncbi:MAG: DNA repair protein RecO [Bacillota bacterium]
MALYDTDAIVLRHYELGEADKIIVLFSRERGKIRVVAKGVRKTKSTLAAGLEPFTHNHILVYQGNSDLGNLSQCDIETSFADLRSDFVKTAYASYAAELVNELTIDNDINKLLFDLLLLTYRLLSTSEKNNLIIRTFELKLLNILGYRPHLDNCVKCGAELDSNFYFSAAEGGLLCSSCTGNWNQKISLGTIKFMNRLLDSNYKSLMRLNLPAYAKEELGSILPNYIEHIIDKPLKSVSFLELV